MTGRGIPGRPRSEQSEQAILAAAASLLAERGIGKLSIEEVAERSRTGKATIYRRWPSKGALALDAFLSVYLGESAMLADALEHDRGSLEGDLAAALRAWATTVTGTAARRMLTGLVAEVQRDPALAVSWRERVLEPVREASSELLARAVRRGEIASDTDVELALDLVFGPAYHRLLNGHLPLDERFCDDLAAAVARALGARPPRRGAGDGQGDAGPDRDGPDREGTGRDGTVALPVAPPAQWPGGTEAPPVPGGATMVRWPPRS